MAPVEKDLPQRKPAPSNQWPTHPEIEPRETRNLTLLAIHQVVFRVGWIFKTENVIMPAFLDYLAGAGWLRGCIPTLKRFGQSLPPVFLAERLKGMRQKKFALAACVLLMSLPFMLLSIACHASAAERFAWMPALFLVLYGLFFIFYGLYLLSFGTVQGKLIRPRRRGFLLLISTFWGTLPAMAFAWWLLSYWLQLPGGGFGYIFGFTAICFLLSGPAILLVSEPADDTPPGPTARAIDCLADTWAALRRDANLRRLVVVAMLFGSGLIIAPHYQALAREKLGLSGMHLMVWVITQNASVGVLSLVVGPLADALGNRFTLRTLILGSAVAPLFATLLAYHGQSWAGLFWLVYIPLGIAPLGLGILANYTLEICDPADHPRYLSTVNLCLAASFTFSPLVGWLVDLVGFATVFLSAAGLILLGGRMTFGLEEPRHRVDEDRIGPFDAGG